MSPNISKHAHPPWPDLQQSAPANHMARCPLVEIHSGTLVCQDILAGRNPPCFDLHISAQHVEVCALRTAIEGELRAPRCFKPRVCNSIVVCRALDM